MNRWHAHWEPKPPEGATPEAEGLSTTLLAAAILIAFLAVFVIPALLGWHG